MVDRDRALRAALARVLEDAGHTVETVASVPAASATPGRADVVITDEMSPTITGAGALVLVTTSDANEAARVEAFEAGADDLVVRPFSLREVVLRVRARSARRTRPTSSRSEISGSIAARYGSGSAARP